jgi:glycerophosphoryl diester phosphodiesterase
MAHRGDSANIPENTLSAFQDAYRLNVDCLETDVRMTADQQFVLLHDKNLNRTFNAKGLVNMFSLTELKQLDAGYWFQSKTLGSNVYPYRGKGLQIQTLDEILPQFPHVRFNLDIKDTDPKAPHLLAKKLEQLQVQQRVMVGSFHQSQIIEFRNCSSIPTSAGPFEVWQFRKKAIKWIHSQSKSHLQNINQELSQNHVDSEKLQFQQFQQEIFGKVLPYNALQIPETLLFLRIITPTFISFAHLLGIAVMVWTVNNEVQMRKLLEWGVDGIFTDTPTTLLKVLKENDLMKNKK